jgi:hypothetical protein
MVLLATTALATPALATEKTTTRTQTALELRHAGHVIQFFQTRNWMRAPNHLNCRTVPWTRTCAIARRVYRHHTHKIQRLEKQLWRTIPMTSNWTRAMRYAQRPFPGTYDWLEAISNRECRACYTTTAFVCNYQGSGACGPLQFMSGTFYGHAPSAKAWLKAHGFVVPAAAWDWRSQLGQALTGAYMRFTGRDGCHWCL